MFVTKTETILPTLQRARFEAFKTLRLFPEVKEQYRLLTDDMYETLLEESLRFTGTTA